MGEAVLSHEQACWILQEAVTLTIASADAERRPSIAQAIGCRILDERRRVRLLLLEPRNRIVVADLRAGRPVALLFTHGFSLRSLQLKAAGGIEQPVTPADHDCINAYIGSMHAQWPVHGVPIAYLDAMLPREPGPLLAFEFVPESAFDQTPGPRAGTLMPGGA